MGTNSHVEARLKRAHNGPAAVVAGDGRPLPGWSVTAIGGDRAWLKTPKGQEVTGERLTGVGAVRAVDAIRGIVVMGDGRGGALISTKAPGYATRLIIEEKL